MEWFNNIKIRNKLFILFGALVLFMAFFSLFTLTQIDALGSDINGLINSYQTHQVHVANAIADFYELRVANLSRGYQLGVEDYKNAVMGMQVDYDYYAASFIKELNLFSE